MNTPYGQLEALLQNLRECGLTVAFAESCTGGRLCADLTTVPGSSDVVVGSAVCYQLAAKRKVLGLEDVDEQNVVSGQTALAMATATRRLFGADFGVATTGYLSPHESNGQAWEPAAYWAIAGPQVERWDGVELSSHMPRDLNRELVVRATMQALVTAVSREKRSPA